MPQPTPGWYSTPADNQIVRWWDGAEWQNRYASVLESGTEAATVPEQIYALKMRHIEEQAQSQHRTNALEQEVAWLRAERGMPAKEILEQVASLKEELLAISGQINNARRTLDYVKAEAAPLQAQRAANDPVFPEYSTLADSSVEVMAEIRELRKTAKALVRSGKGHTFWRHVFTSQQGYEVSLPDWQVADIAKELLAILNRHVEIEASRKTGEYDTLAVTKTFWAMNHFAFSVGIELSDEYEALRIKELELLSLHRAMQSEERENARYERAEAREEARAQKELEREKVKLEKDLEHHFNAMAALERNGDQPGAARLALAIAELERKLENIDLRSLNMKTGYVYVISNIGAFGSGIVKIGLTRRLDPLDRISELSSASVPYRFDVHALFFSEDAVGIERMLHKHFDHRRVNLVNKRKEFFRATPSEVLTVLHEHRVELVDWADEPKAFEYRLGLQRSRFTEFSAHAQTISTP